MSQLSTSSYKNLYGTSGTEFPDNTTQEISEGDMRTFGENTADSFWNKTDFPVAYVKSTDAQQVGNVGSGEDNLMGYVVSANMLASNGDSLLIRAHGHYATNGNTKVLRVKLGATTLFSKSGTPSDDDWSLEIEIIRTTSATQKCNVKYMTSAGAIDSTYTAASIDLTSATTVFITGEATADDDIVKHVAKITFEPAGSFAI